MKAQIEQTEKLTQTKNIFERFNENQIRVTSIRSNQHSELNHLEIRVFIKGKEIASELLYSKFKGIDSIRIVFNGIKENETISVNFLDYWNQFLSETNPEEAQKGMNDQLKKDFSL